MTQKEAVIKGIMEMNTSLLDVVLDDYKAYMEVPKSLFLERLGKEFESLNKEGITQFDQVAKGTCGNCHKGCGGFSFITKHEDYMDVVFIEDKEGVKDLHVCNDFQNDEALSKNNLIHFRFKDEEKVNYRPSADIQMKQNNIQAAMKEFEDLENSTANIEEIVDWISRYGELYGSLSSIEDFNYSLISSFRTRYIFIEPVAFIVKDHVMAIKAMKEFQFLDFSSDLEVIDWLLKYEDNGLFNQHCYEELEDYQNSYLISCTRFEKLILNVEKYKESIDFNKAYDKYFYLCFDKFKLIPDNFSANLEFKLSQFLAYYGYFPELLEKYNIELKAKPK